MVVVVAAAAAKAAAAAAAKTGYIHRRTGRTAVGRYRSVADDANLLPCLDHQIRADAKAAGYCRRVRASGAVTDHQLILGDGHGQAVDTEAAALQSGQGANLARAAVDAEAAASLHRDLVDYHVGKQERARLLHREVAPAPACACGRSIMSRSRDKLTQIDKHS